MSKKWGGLIKAVGMLLTLVALFYVGWNLLKTGAFESPAWFEPQLWLAIAVAAVLYCAALILIGRGWVGLVANASDVPLPTRQGLAPYAQSHLYKYLPSNLLHYVSRQALLSRRGISHAAIAWGSFIETVLMVISALTVAGFFSAPLLARVLSADWLIPLALVVCALAVLGALALLATRRTLGLGEFLSRLNQRQAWGALVQAYILFVLFFFVSGAALWFLIRWGSNADADFSTATAIGAVAWALGFLTPGATAGIGVREASIIAGLVASSVPNEKAVLAAVTYRVVTTIGDLLFAGAGYVLARYYSQPAID